MEPLTEVAKEVASEVATSLLAKIKKHVEYLYKYKDNLKDLEDAIAKLDAKRTYASCYSDDASRRLRDVSRTVAIWQSDANELLQKAENAISRNNISCLNLCSRYSASKRAWELTQLINKKVESAPDFGTSFDHTIAQGAKFNLRGFTDFDSRIEILNGVLEALNDEDVSMCSICGMGGIGKTTLAKKLVQIVEADRLFHKVAMVTVSQNPDFEKIQKEIIELLGLTINETIISGRANKLNDWLSNHRTLLILDDVWWQLHDEDFDNVGIPLGTERCKIVVTSRNEDECNKMGSQQKFLIKLLEHGEARDLFIQYAGQCDKNLQETAREIVRECNSLPIAIVTVARALKDKPEGVWYDSLLKLKKSNMQGISGMEKVYLRIQLSYDLLNDEEAQSCFRLCCLFPEDYDVPVEKLVFYGKGLVLFKDAESLKEARDRVVSIIYKLKKSFLLLDGKGDGYVKLHDIVRDFAISISMKDEYPYLVRCEKEMKKWLETYQVEKFGAISIVCNTIKDGISIDLRCPNLKLLQIHSEDGSGELPIGFFKGMEELRVVDLQVWLPSLSLTIQKKLRTLLINNRGVYGAKSVDPVYFGEILGHGDMKNLEIFSLSSTRFSDFPQEIGQLWNLRCLRFMSTVSFKYMPEGVLSKLVKLEELALPLDFKNWGLQEKGGNRVNASLNEIEPLQLASINIGIPKGSVLVEKLVYSITRFQISFGVYLRKQGFGLDSNVLLVNEVDACDGTTSWICSLLRKCDFLVLRSVSGLKYIMFQLYRGNKGFPCTYFSHMKTLKIKNMDSLKEIWDGPYLSNIQSPCFPNLTRIEIWYCPKLKHVFPLSVATELKQLQHMELSSCHQMEEIFYKDRVNGAHQIMEESSEREVNGVIVLPRLKQLKLQYMRTLRILHNGNHVIEFPSLEELTILECDKMEALSYGSFNAPTTKVLELAGVVYVKSIIKWLNFKQGNGIPQLTILKIARCHEMKYLVDAIDDPNPLKTFFSGLVELCIYEMDRLEKIWHRLRFPNLTQIEISACPKLKHVFPLSAAAQLRQLQRMEIYQCEEMEEIFYKDQIMEESIQKVDKREVDRVIILPRLKQLQLVKLHKLRIVIDGKHAIECPALEYLRIENCNNMEALSYGSFNTSTTKEIRLVGVRHVKNIIKWLHLEQDNGIPQLQKLLIQRCKEMKYLVDAIEYRNLLKAFFSHLEELSIHQMDSLEEIWHEPCFPNLTRIEIKECPKLKHVLPLSVATQLRQLQRIQIYQCEEMEEIFYKDQSMEEMKENRAKLDAMDAIIFPQLVTLSLFELSKLRILYDGNHAMELPSLEYMYINKCDNIEALSKGSVKAPKLKEIQINRMMYPSGSDLNTIVREAVQ